MIVALGHQEWQCGEALHDRLAGFGTRSTLKQLVQDQTSREDRVTPAPDYYVIEAGCDTFYVTREVAGRVVENLRRAWPPRWIEFTDLAGSGIRIRTRLIDCVRECTGAQRVAARVFRRARRQEEKADRRPWEDDDWW